MKTKKYVLESDPGGNLSCKLCTSCKLHSCPELGLHSCGEDRTCSPKGIKSKPSASSDTKPASIGPAIEWCLKGSQSRCWVGLPRPKVRDSPQNCGGQTLSKVPALGIAVRRLHSLRGRENPVGGEAQTALQGLQRYRGRRIMMMHFLIPHPCLDSWPL